MGQAAADSHKGAEMADGAAVGPNEEAGGTAARQHDVAGGKQGKGSKKRKSASQNNGDAARAKRQRADQP